MAKRKTLNSVALYGTLITLGCIFLFPVYWMILTSLSKSTELRSFPPRFIPKDPQWGTFSQLLAEHPFDVWFMNSLKIAIAVLIISLTVSVLAAYALSRFRLKGGQGMGLFILTAKMLPGTLIIIPFFVIFRSMGLIGSLWSVIIAQATMIIPFATWMLKGYFDTIPVELEQAAIVDGCSPIGTIFRIVLPVSAPGLAATSLYSFVLSWSDFLFARTFVVTSESLWTLNLGISSFKGEWITDWNIVMAASLMASLPIIVVFLFLERYMVGGLAAGAEK
ncbi:carbohydrate ABC transporter permease [Halocynthiibacter sp. C4]|uniref:carbohydrate ABC transporter permease n=1 Tax=Halocynthiibacter sp. C4 TaxID=2992758 RepID=UPI00237A0D32|nr:carbohydrate ABC transporter permease [Halocynthiibacter sp. C4]MDE0591568.1 carbohydrate ABC transporter permease [Halocynthiibacter sp. C4]